MIGLWAISIILTLVFISSIPFILSGKGDALIIRDEFKHLYKIKRLRVLMAVLSSFAAVFCILTPFMVKDNRENLLLSITLVLFFMIIVIIILIKTWAKYK